MIRIGGASLQVTRLDAPAFLLAARALALASPARRASSLRAVAESPRMRALPPSLPKLAGLLLLPGALMMSSARPARLSGTARH